MDIKYKIVEVWPENLTFVIRYYTDFLTEEMLAVDDNKRPDGTPVRCRTDVSYNIPFLESEKEKRDFLESLKTLGPLDYFKRQEKIIKEKDYVQENVDYVQSLLDIENQTSLEEIEKIIESKNVKRVIDEEELDNIIENITEILGQEPKQQETS